MLSHFLEIPYSDLRTLVVTVLRQGGGSRPDVLHLRHGDDDAVLKDHNCCDARFARWLGPLLTRREAKALAILEDVVQVPTLVGRVDRRALLMEYVVGSPVRGSEGDFDWPRFFERFYALLDEMHRRGVAHCDLRSPGNILLGCAGEPVIMDFVACVFAGARWNLPQRWLFTRFCRVDHSAVVKLKSRVAPDLITSAESKYLRPSGRLDRAARGFGVWIRRQSRALLTASRR